MLRLLQRQRSVDLMFDERLPDRDWTLRRTWRDVCDGLERGYSIRTSLWQQLMVIWSCLNFSESDVRGALINSLKMDVVAPLQELKVRPVHYLHPSRFSMFQILIDIALFNLKETHERSRKRIKEDIKSSLTQYNEYSENVLPRLKRLYIKRCQEADELKAAGDPKINSTSPIISNPILPKPGVPFPQNSPTSSQGAGISTNMPTGGTERGRRQSTATSQGKRDRSPSSNTTSFSDLAQQGGSHALKCVGEYSRP
jgi:hypothetical protein